MSGPIPAIEPRQKQVVLAQFYFSGNPVYQASSKIMAIPTLGGV